MAARGDPPAARDGPCKDGREQGLMDHSKSTKKPMTSRELAALIGVSQSAVSRAFTPGSSIARDLRERILMQAREYGYQPNAIASMLTKRRTNIVGIVVSDMRNPFYPALIEKLTQALQRAGLQSLLFNVTPGAEIEKQLVAIHTYNVDAVVVIASTMLNSRMLTRITEGRKAVLLNRIGHEDIASVCCDNALGARLLVDHLYEAGHRRIGHVAGMTSSGIGMLRYSAFTSRLAELGMRLTRTVSHEAFSYEAGWDSALDLLADEPDAIFFTSDILALGGIDALRTDPRGAGVGVVGFDDIPMAAWPNYSLTTYRQPVSAIAETTTRLLTEDGPTTPKLYSLPGELVIRASSAPRITGAE